MRVLRLGRVAYLDAHALQREVLADRIAGRVEDTLILCEHDPVFTVGRRRGAEANVLCPGEVPVIAVERGGDVTFHGPGQLVGYPIFQLAPGRQDLLAWMRGLEAVLIDTLAGYGVSAGRDPRNTGVWVDGRKIAAIGVACRSWVTWHGLALNVCTDLGWYSRINPCGMDSALTTRLADHLTPCPLLEEVADRIAAAFEAWWTDWRTPGSAA